MQSNDRRHYIRSSHFHCIAKLKTETNYWKEVKIYDLSSGGLKLRCDDEFAPGDELMFDLNIQGFMSEFSVKVKGVVRRKEIAAYNLYGVGFVDLSQDLQIRIDENVRGDRPVGRGAYSAD